MGHGVTIYTTGYHSDAGARFELGCGPFNVWRRNCTPCRPRRYRRFADRNTVGGEVDAGRSVGCSQFLDLSTERACLYPV